MSGMHAVTMTHAESELIAAYRLSDARGKQTIMERAKSMAEDWPEPRPASATEDGRGSES